MQQFSGKCATDQLALNLKILQLHLVGRCRFSHDRMVHAAKAHIKTRETCIQSFFKVFLSYHTHIAIAVYDLRLCFFLLPYHPNSSFRYSSDTAHVILCIRFSTYYSSQSLCYPLFIIHYNTLCFFCIYSFPFSFIPNPFPLQQHLKYFLFLCGCPLHIFIPQSHFPILNPQFLCLHNFMTAITEFTQTFSHIFIPPYSLHYSPF